MLILGLYTNSRVRTYELNSSHIRTKMFLWGVESVHHSYPKIILSDDKILKVDKNQNCVIIGV